MRFVELYALVLHFAHAGLIFRPVVIKAEEMKHPVNNHPQKFILKGNAPLQGVLFRPVNADENVCLQRPGMLPVRKGYYVGIIIVVQILSVEFQKIFIRAEYEIETQCLCIRILQYLFYPISN